MLGSFAAKWSNKRESFSLLSAISAMFYRTATIPQHQATASRQGAWSKLLRFAEVSAPHRPAPHRQHQISSVVPVQWNTTSKASVIPSHVYFFRSVGGGRCLLDSSRLGFAR